CVCVSLCVSVCVCVCVCVCVGVCAQRKGYAAKVTLGSGQGIGCLWLPWETGLFTGQSVSEHTVYRASPRTVMSAPQIEKEQIVCVCVCVCVCVRERGR